MTYLDTPQHNDPCPGGHEIYNLGRPLLGYHYYTLVHSEEIPQFYINIFTPKFSPFGVGS